MVSQLNMDDNQSSLDLRETLVKLIEHSDMSIREIGVRSGVSREAIQGWINKGATPNIDNAQWVLQALGMELTITKAKGEMQI